MMYRFSGFELDTELFELRRGREPIAVEPQVFDLLVYLVRHRDRVVSKQQLFEALWPDRFVGEASLSSRIKSARKAVGDNGQDQRIIRTLRGRGFRFVAPLDEIAQVSAETDTPPPVHAGKDIVSFGRDVELAQLDRLFEAARTGSRQVVFVSGDAGLGKTTLVEAFMERLRARSDGALRVSVGRCVEQHGNCEAYLPVLDALGRLLHGPGGRDLAPILQRCAPSWWLQMPALGDSQTADALRATAGSGSPERMLREMIDAIEQMSIASPLLLVLEDLHWADVSTTDLLLAVAKRPETARLMIVATFRRTDAERSGHPIIRVANELTLRCGAEELALGLLSEDTVGLIVRHHLPGGDPPVGLTSTLWERTDGNPLFLMALLKAWLERGLLRDDSGRWELARPVSELAVEVPDTVAELIEQRLSGLSEADQALLAAASVAGVQFTPALLSQALGKPEAEVEQRCERLARQGGFVRELGVVEWPDGTIAAQFAFIHDLFVQVLYERVAVGRRVRLHRHIGARLEAAFAAQLRSCAAELARHFQQGRDVVRAARYIRLAAEQALERSAYREATTYLRKGLALVDQLPDDAREWHELELLILLGVALTATTGYAAPEVERTYERASELADRLDHRQLPPILYGLWRYYVFRADYRRAETLGRRILALTEGPDDDGYRAKGHRAVAGALFYPGRLAECEQHLHKVIGHSPRGGSKPLADVLDTQLTCRVYWGWTRWFRGFPQAAFSAMQAAVTDATALGHPFTLALAHSFSAGLFQFAGIAEEVAPRADALRDLAEAHRFAIWIGAARCLTGWCVARHGDPAAGIAGIERGLEAWSAAGSRLAYSWFLTMLADAQLSGGRLDDALGTLDTAEAFVDETGERWLSPELARMRANLLRASQPEGAAGWLETAVSRGREAGSLTLTVRAARDLVALRVAQGRAAQALPIVKALLPELASVERELLTEAKRLAS